MNVFILGKNTIAVKCTEIIKRCESINIVGICPNNSDTGKDGWQLSLMKYSKNNNLPLFKLKKIKSTDSLAILNHLRIDFIFSFQYNQILNEEVFKQSKFGAINLHLGPLPRYRGISPIAFALINGEKEFGVTLHYMDQGVDRGDTIDQLFFNIEHIKNGRELYELCVKNAILLFNRNFEDIIFLRNKRIPQDDRNALYYPMGSIDFSDNILNPNLSTTVLYNWCRAFIFPPFQYPIFLNNGEKFKVIYVAPDYRKNNFEKPGTVVESNNYYFKIATHDCYLNLIAEKCNNKI